jgi:hypothetical protein
VEKKKSPALTRVQTPTVQPVASHYTNYVILASLLKAVIMKIIVFWNLNSHSLVAM